MLSISTLAAAALLTASAVPFPTEKASKTVSQEVAIRSTTLPLVEQKLECSDCEKFRLPGPRPYEMSPERRALLNTIRYAEGTWKDGQDVGYRVMFGGKLTLSLDRHPDRVQYSPGYASAAAGAYQFLPATWSEASRKLSLKTFEPQNQDQAALFLIQRRGALVMADRGQLTPSLANRLAPEWASFPTYNGNSYYGQPVKRLSDLQRFYQENLKSLRNSMKQQEKENA
jgi:muramidase (phage lysozyme)